MLPVEIRPLLDATLEDLKAIFVGCTKGRGVTQAQYVRYLSDQSYIVRDVCTQMLTMAANPTLRQSMTLRKFLIEFGLEEESHYRMAEADIRQLGAEVQPPSLDARLWYTYFSSLVPTQPMRRLGASVVLENAGSVMGDVIRGALDQSPFLTAASTRFIRQHLHADDPHGEELMAVLGSVNWTPELTADLAGGIRESGLMLGRLIHSSFE